MDLAVKSREIVGKKVKALRKEGLIPAELYGHGIKNSHLSVSAKDFNKIFKEAGMSTILTLLMDQEKRPAIIHEVSHDSVSGDVIHIDFHQVRMDEKIKAKVPVEFVGEAPAVKEKGAVVNKAIYEIEVEALPGDLPHKLVVDLSSLDDLNKSVYVRDIKVPKGVEILIQGDSAVATATPPAPEEEKVEVPSDVTAVVVETEEKKAERQAEKAAGGDKGGDKGEAAQTPKKDEKPHEKPQEKSKKPDTK
jgi:large subunit ribosomal protein L25